MIKEVIGVLPGRIGAETTADKRTIVVLVLEVESIAKGVGERRDELVQTGLLNGAQ